jgi:molybdopterin converting factor small subunit
VTVHLWSYFRDLAGTARLEIELPVGSSIAQLLDAVYRVQPKLAGLRKSTLIAVGVDYQRADYPLQPGDEVSLFPPVQGG